LVDALKTPPLRESHASRFNIRPHVVSPSGARAPYARFVSLRAAALAFFAVATLAGALAPPALAVTSEAIVSTVNAERGANHLPLVREDPLLSSGCAQYDNYRHLNGRVQNAFTPGPEQASAPGYTAAGARASHDSLLNAGDRLADSFASGDVFDDAPNHLAALMDPAVSVVGADQLDVELGAFYGTASLSCVDVRSAPQRPRPHRVRVYAYVGPGGRAPHEPRYREGPSGRGAFIFVYFFGPAKARVALRSLSIRTAHGASVHANYLGFNGGLIDGRSRARTAIARAHIANKVGSSVDPYLAVRVMFKEGEELDDLLRYKAEVHFRVKTYEQTGQLPVPHD
jgi:hypothetical protein